MHVKVKARQKPGGRTLLAAGSLGGLGAHLVPQNAVAVVPAVGHHPLQAGLLQHGMLAASDAAGMLGRMQQA